MARRHLRAAGDRRPDTPRSRGRRLALPAAIALGLATIGAIAVASAYAPDLRAARERVDSAGRVVQTRCGPIEYAEVGSGPAVLVVHGAGGGYDQGLDFGAPLAAQGLRVIAPSRFGYLRTPLPADASAEAQADAHACLLDALGIARAAIVGASAGAPSAMQFALRHADRCGALALVVPAAYVPRAGGAASMKTPAWTRVLFDTALRSDFLFWIAPRIARGAVLRGIVATPPAVVDAASPDEQARVDRMIRHILPVSPRRLGLLNDAEVTSALPRYDLEHLHVPTLVASAADDLFGTFDGARYTAEHVPGARFIGYPTGGHLLVGHQRDLTAALLAFLR
jgi:pimeloyl-ACP methyl ester carboxylesterase